MEEKKKHDLPDHLRCNRTDGRQWRCNRPVVEGKKLCKIHYLQGRHRQNKQKVPEALKIQRGPRNSLNRYPNEVRVPKVVKLAKRKRVIGESEAIDKALKRMKLKKGDAELELIKLVLIREVEKRKKKGRIEVEESGSEGEVKTKHLPNGLMAISPAPLPQETDNAASPCEVKIGVDVRPVMRRCFRSKNIEPLPLGALQVVPVGRGVKKWRKKRCHLCRKSGCQSLVKCSSCLKEFFCLRCIEKRYFETQEVVKMACPICRGSCRCKACLANQCNNIERKDQRQVEHEMNKILCFHYLICMLLPVLKEINQEQNTELEREAKIRGKEPTRLDIKLADSGCNKKHCCSYCNLTIVDLHRNCPNCSYKLCLSCCRELCQATSPEGLEELVCRFFNRKLASMPGQECDSEESTEVCEKNLLTCPSSITSPQWKTCNFNDGISCPPAKFGGCGNCLLSLRCIFPLDWTKILEASAEEIVCSYDLPETPDLSSRCSLCLPMGHEDNDFEELREAARREYSNDNFLYYPTYLESHNDNLEHFQKHWGKSHPVIVRNVLQSASELSWDPIVMFCTYLENSVAKFENDHEQTNSPNCPDWCEVEIGTRQLYMGSLNGQMQANKCQMLKLKAWLSSLLFQEQFPAHYAEIISSLPLQEYMNPKSGLLNLAANLPQHITKPDLGPCVYISYSRGENIVQNESVTKLRYGTYDVVNILTQITDATVSSEQLTNIKKLMKRRYEAQECRDSVLTRTKNVEEEAKGKGKSMLPDGSLDEVGWQHLKRDANLNKSVSGFPSSTHEASSLTFEDRNNSHDGKRDLNYIPCSDSDASTRCHGTAQYCEASGAPKICTENVEKSGGFQKEITSSSCGSQWDVFRRQDVPKLTEYLRRHSDEFTHTRGFREEVSHPIFDESFFLDTAHKIRLKEEFQIEPWTFKQHVGEAVIIPAGCPYQIRNLKSCVNVVLNFVSPESVSKCILLNKDLHSLPEDHKVKVDNFEVKKIALYSISEAVKEVRELTLAKSLAELNV